MLVVAVVVMVLTTPTDVAAAIEVSTPAAGVAPPHTPAAGKATESAFQALG